MKPSLHLTALTLLLAACPLAAGSPDARLSDERWSEASHGLSIRLPKNARLAPSGIDDRLLQVHTPEGIMIELSLHTASGAEEEGPRYREEGEDQQWRQLQIRRGTLELDNLRKQAITQMGLVHPNARILSERQLELATGETALLYFLYGEEGRNRIEGQALSPLGPRTLFRARVVADHHRQEAAQKLFEAVLGSLTRRDPEALARERAERVEAGAELAAALTPEAIHAAIIPERWFRIVNTQSGEDVGYVRIREEQTTQMQLEGVRVEIQSRSVRDRLAHDTYHEMFRADAEPLEVWSIRAGVRPLRSTGAADNEIRSEAETGVRDGATITVSREGNRGIDRHRWKIPGTGYLGQVATHFLGRLLGERDLEAFGFYVYLPDKRKLTFRAYDRQALPGGGYQVQFRPSPEMAPQVEKRSPEGKLLQRTLGPNRALIPARAEEIARRWPDR